MNLNSSINKGDKYVTQIVHFVGGVKRTFNGINPHTLKQGQFTKMERKDGSYLMIHDDNVLCVEVYEEDEEIIKND